MLGHEVHTILFLTFCSQQMQLKFSSPHMFLSLTFFLPQPSGAPWSLVTSVLCSKEESMSCFLSWNKQRSRSTTQLLLSTLITVQWQHNMANLHSPRYCTHTHKSGSVSLCFLIFSTNVFLIVNSGLELHKTKQF